MLWVAFLGLNDDIREYNRLQKNLEESVDSLRMLNESLADIYSNRQHGVIDVRIVNTVAAMDSVLQGMQESHEKSAKMISKIRSRFKEEWKKR